MLWHGLDISHWDGDIDLAAWKRKRGIKFVIVKAGGNERGLGRYRDPRFDANYKKAVAAGLHVGAYYYGVSTDTANARADADHCAQLLAGKSFDMPVYYDVEDGKQLAIGQRALTDVVKAFCDRIGVLGYCAGLYTGGYAYRGNMYGVEELSRYADWIAWWREAWPTECGDVGMHQVGGISITGDVVYDDVAGHHDYDRCIIDYPSRIKPKPDPAPVPDPAPAGDESGTVEKLMSVAYAELGYYAPSDPERGSKYGRWLAELTGEDWLAGPSTSIWWCCMYVSYVLYHAGVTVKGFPTQNTDLALNGGARNYCVDKHSIRRGDVIIFDWNWDGATDHIGIATSGIRDGVFTTIEGNVGNAVVEKTRDLGNVAYVIRPHYSGKGTPDTPEPPAPTPKNNRDGGKLDTDGIGGWNTVIDLQHLLGTREDGVISGQPQINYEYWWGMSAAIKTGTGGSPLVKAIQRLVGAGVDGYWGKQTSEKLQEYLVKLGYHIEVDGYFGRASVEALQKAINDGKFAR